MKPDVTFEILDKDTLNQTDDHSSEQPLLVIGLTGLTDLVREKLGRYLRKGSDPGHTPLFSLFFISSEEELRQELEFERNALVSAESNNL